MKEHVTFGDMHQWIVRKCPQIFEKREENKFHHVMMRFSTQYTMSIIHTGCYHRDYIIRIEGQDDSLTIIMRDGEDLSFRIHRFSSYMYCIRGNTDIPPDMDMEDPALIEIMNRYRRCREYSYLEQIGLYDGNHPTGMPISLYDFLVHCVKFDIDPVIVPPPMWAACITNQMIYSRDE